MNTEHQLTVFEVYQPQENTAGKEVLVLKEKITDAIDVLGWIHKHTPYSMHTAISCGAVQVIMIDATGKYKLVLKNGTPVYMLMTEEKKKGGGDAKI